MGRICGPFNVRPLPSLRCSGLGIVPKKGNKWRMILHLSAPFGSSINDFISKESFSLQYFSMDDAVWFLVSLGPGTRMAKADLKSAFRMVPVLPQDWELLGMRWQGAYYFDTCLPFGLHSAPFLFSQYTKKNSRNFNKADTIHVIVCRSFDQTHKSGAKCKFMVGIKPDVQYVNHV